GALDLQFLLVERGFCCILFYGGQALLGFGVPGKAGGTKEYDGILDLLTAKPRQRFLVFRQYAKNAPVGTVQKSLIPIGKGRRLQFFSHAKVLVRQTCWPSSATFRILERQRQWES